MYAGFYTTTQLLTGRGWSRRLIADLLGGAPDRLVTYPKSVARLWDVARVTVAETAAVFVAYQDPSVRRSIGATAAAKRKRNRHARQLEQVEIRVRRVDIAEVRRRALDAYTRSRVQWEQPTGDAPPIDQLAVDYIRYALTAYTPSGARSALRERALAAIAVVYPELALEARRQRAQ
jgi:hypothetical protein